MKPWGKAAVTSAALSALFVVVYGACNVITSVRSEVGSFYFDWERAIPFWPVFVVPYMSIDLFFIAGPFFCRSDRERAMFAKRIVAAILIAAAGFLLWPLRFAFERPHVEGVLGVIFNNFRRLDLPFNEFPSLHLALGLILADLYLRHVRGVLRIGLGVWFVLIGMSSLVTYQHHLMDVVGGMILGVLCVHFVRETPVRVRYSPNLRVGGYYAVGAAALAVCAANGGPWSWVLLWPAGSMAVVAMGYGFVGPGIFGKFGGRLSWTTRVVLGPVLVGHWISRMYYGRQCRAYDRVTESLWIGRHLSSVEARELRAGGVSAVVDLAPEFSEPRELLDVAYLYLPVIDLTAPTLEQLDEAMAFIGKQEGIVYVHCKIGYSRTAAVAGAYLMASGRAEGAEHAVGMLRAARPPIVVRPEVLAVLRAFEVRQRRAWESRNHANLHARVGPGLPSGVHEAAGEGRGEGTQELRH